MEFGLTETQQMYRKQIREFVEENVIDENRDWDDTENFPHDLVSQLADLGVMGMNIPSEAGGQGLDPLTTGVVYEQLGRGDVALTMLLMVQNLANRVLWEFGSDEHSRIAKENARGEIFLAWGLTEPGHGADARSIETVAERIESGWMLNGEKTAITGATFADHVVLYARTTDDEIRAFLVPLRNEGIEVQPYEGLGGRVSGWGHIFMDDAKISESALINDQDGFKIAMQRFDPSRAWIPLYCLGAAQQTLDETEEYLQEREAFGEPIASFQGPQFEIAEMRSKVEAARLKAYEALWLAREGEEFTMDASMAKLLGTEWATNVIHDCIILHGHYGYSEDFGLGKRLRDVIGLEIGEGPPQIQKIVIAREIFGREYLPY